MPLTEEPFSTPPMAAILSFAKRHGVLHQLDEQGRLFLFHRHNAPLFAILELRRQLAQPVVLQVISDETFDAMLRHAFEINSSLAIQDAGEVEESLDLSQAALALGETQDLIDSTDSAPVIRLINALMTEAVKYNASDIHLEPYEECLSIRIRVDGVLRTLLDTSMTMSPFVVSRIKVMAHLDIAEKRLPQDGRISLRIAGQPIDVRVSTIPTGRGERVVLRLLDKQAGRMGLDQLGMPLSVLSGIKEVVKKPHGILLVTGPTGSGKTTTLYAVLKHLNDRTRNIMTVEDPIEYELPGISQTHVNPKVDLTFARGLRAILRQDPDIIMVGEIRDQETARVAVQASLTGHLVLSTLHTNSAMGAITRLRDMGIESFLLSSSLIGVLAQRLVRLLCAACLSQGSTKCWRCGGSSYAGRTGVYELLVIDDSIRQAIHDHAGEGEIARLAPTFHTLLDDGNRLIEAGLTSREEVLRVLQDS